MMGSVASVYVGSCDPGDVDAIARHVQSALEALGVVRPPGDVLLQPSCPWSHPRYAPEACTDPTTIEGVARSFDGSPLALGVQSLPGFPTRYTTRQASYDRLAARLSARLVRFDEAAFRPVAGATIGRPDGGATEATLELPAAWSTAAFRVSIPRLCGSTILPFAGAVRHLYDLLPHPIQSAEHHRFVEALELLNRIAAPDLIVMDATRATHEGGELSGKPVDLGMFIIGTDAVAVDLVAASAYGVSDAEMGFLPSATSPGNVPRTVTDLEILGDLSLDDVRERSRQVRRLDPNPEAFPLPAKVRVARSPRARLTGPAGALTEVLAMLRLAGISLDAARETTFVLGPAEAIPAGTTDYSTIVFLGDTARGEYSGYSRVVRLAGRNPPVSRLLQDVPFAMTVANVRSDLGWQFMAAGLGARVARGLARMGGAGGVGANPPPSKGGGDRSDSDR
jgi:uncharacterized protein (DUF362 family)